MKRIILLGLAIILAGLFVYLAPEQDNAIGHGDFRGYWGASYLLARSENFADPDLLLEIQQQETGHARDYPVMAWNPPWLLVLLAPLTIIPFTVATRVWLLFNIGAIFAASMVCLRVFAAGKPSKRWVFIAPLIAFAFQPTLITLLMGQVNTLVLLGLVLFLFFRQTDKPFLAGMALSLTTIKPHLVYLTLPICLLECYLNDRKRVLAGFLTALALFTAVVFALRPTFLNDYVGVVLRQNRLLQWQVPTVSSAIAVFTGWEAARYLALGILPLTLFLWYRKYQHLDIRTVVSIGTILSLATAPFGWSYDQILLIIPIMQLFLIVFTTSTKVEQLVVALAIITINAYSFYLRIHSSNEVVFFWIVPAVGLVYWLAMRQVFSRNAGHVRDLAAIQVPSTN